MYSFYTCRSQKRKNLSSCQYHFMLLGSAHVKAAQKTLMKSPPIVFDMSNFEGSKLRNAPSQTFSLSELISYVTIVNQFSINLNSFEVISRHISNNETYLQSLKLIRFCTFKLPIIYVRMHFAIMLTANDHQEMLS